MTPSETKRKIAIAAASIDRFYDEGLYAWPEDKFRALFSGVSLEEEAIQTTLALRERSGAIEVRPRAQCFVEVLRPVGTLCPP